MKNADVLLETDSNALTARHSMMPSSTLVVFLTGSIVTAATNGVDLADNKPLAIQVLLLLL